MATPVAKGLDIETAVRLRMALGRVSRQMRLISTDAGLTQTESSVLGVVNRRGPLRLQELAGAEGLNPTLVSRVVAKLERSGLVHRLRDPADRRVAWVEATPAGSRLQDRIRRERAETLNRVLAELGPDQHRALIDALPVLEDLAARLTQRRQ